MGGFLYQNVEGPEMLQLIEVGAKIAERNDLEMEEYIQLYKRISGYLPF